MKARTDHVYLEAGNLILKCAADQDITEVVYDLPIPVFPEHYENWCRDHCKRDTWYIEWCFEDYGKEAMGLFNAGESLTYARLLFTNPQDAILFKLSNIQGAQPIYC